MKNSNEAPTADLSDLDLPDWSGMDDSTQRVSPETAFKLCEQYPVLFPEQVKYRLLHPPEKCTVEFAL
jgi:hypothetical protein